MNIDVLIGSGPGWLLIGGPLAVTLIGGAWAERWLRQAPHSERLELRSARAVARTIGILGAVIGAGFLGFAAVLGTGWSGGVNYVVVVAAAALGTSAGVVVWIASLVGIAAAARRGGRRAAVAGAVVGPLILVGTIALGGSVSQAITNARSENAMAAEQARNEFWQAQSARLHVAVEDVSYDSIDFRDVDTGLMRTGIERIRLTLVLYADVDLPVDPNPDRLKHGELTLVPVDPPVRGCVLGAAVPLGGRSSLPAGTDIRIEVEALAPEACENFPAPGAFDAGLNLQTSTDGYVGWYHVSTRLVIDAD